MNSSSSRKATDWDTYLLHNGQASGGQSGGQSLQHSEVEQHSSGAVASTCGFCWEVDLLPANVEAAKAPAATTGIPTTENQSHFLLLMCSLLVWKMNHESHFIDADLNLPIQILFKSQRLNLPWVE